MHVHMMRVHMMHISMMHVSIMWCMYPLWMYPSLVAKKCSPGCALLVAVSHASTPPAGARQAGYGVGKVVVRSPQGQTLSPGVLRALFNWHMNEGGPDFWDGTWQCISQRDDVRPSTPQLLPAVAPGGFAWWMYPWCMYTWCMHVGMMHVSMMRQILWRTNQPTNQRTRRF